jgi:two-component system sensor histidine kinase MprB
MVEVRGDVPERLVRPVALERAVANLVRNAVQVSDDGDHVEVVLDEADGWMVVQVLDRGPGIAEEDLPRIFDRFYRGASARERSGSGLGLAIVAQVVGLHGGEVAAGNRPSGGAVFTLRVPSDASS